MMNETGKIGTLGELMKSAADEMARLIDVIKTQQSDLATARAEIRGLSMALDDERAQNDRLRAEAAHRRNLIEGKLK